MSKESKNNSICNEYRAVICIIYKAYKKLKKNKGRVIDDWGVSNIVLGHKDIVLTSKGVDMDSVSAMNLFTRCSKTLEKPVNIHVALYKDRLNSICKEKEYNKAIKSLRREKWFDRLDYYLREMCKAIGKEEQQLLFVDRERVGWSNVLECDYNESFHYKDNGEMIYATFTIGLH